ncbi:MAG: hypothetical protein LBD38_01095 [Streptococcaceae bacterium]|nr:hypothetical protein [Streptococcaceae bacterium]
MLKQWAAFFLLASSFLIISRNAMAQEQTTTSFVLLPSVVLVNASDIHFGKIANGGVGEIYQALEQFTIDLQDKNQSRENGYEILLMSTVIQKPETADISGIEIAIDAGRAVISADGFPVDEAILERGGIESVMGEKRSLLKVNGHIGNFVKLNWNVGNLFLKMNDQLPAGNYVVQHELEIVEGI